MSRVSVRSEAIREREPVSASTVLLVTWSSVIFAFDRARRRQHAGRAVALIVPASRFPETKTVSGRGSVRLEGYSAASPSNWR
jgi:hypothetical protein